MVVWIMFLPFKTFRKHLVSVMRNECRRVEAVIANMPQLRDVDPYGGKSFAIGTTCLIGLSHQGRTMRPATIWVHEPRKCTIYGVQISFIAALRLKLLWKER